MLWELLKQAGRLLHVRDIVEGPDTQDTAANWFRQLSAGLNVQTRFFFLSDVLQKEKG